MGVRVLGCFPNEYRWYPSAGMRLRQKSTNCHTLGVDGVRASIELETMIVTVLQPYTQLEL